MQRLGKNQGAYHGETIRIREILATSERTAKSNGWSVSSFHSTNGLSHLALLRPPSAEKRHRIYISAGIHGDEPAAPLAALRLLELNHWPANAEIVLLPCLNPEAYEHNRRENSSGVDLNRDYLNPRSNEINAHIAWLIDQASFDLCICLHEDWESHGFYLYELNPDGLPSLAEKMITRVSQVCPIDLSKIIENREANGGIIRPSIDPRTRPLWPESFWLLQNRTRLSYTLEAPSDFPIETRVQALTEAVITAVSEVAAR